MSVQYLERKWDDAKIKYVAPNLTQDGYTATKGSPSSVMIKIGSRWYRIYLLQFSNSGSAFIRINGEKRFLTLSQFSDAYDQAQKNQIQSRRLA